MRSVISQDRLGSARFVVARGPPRRRETPLASSSAMTRSPAGLLRLREEVACARGPDADDISRNSERLGRRTPPRRQRRGRQRCVPGGPLKHARGIGRRGASSRVARTSTTRECPSLVEPRRRRDVTCFGGASSGALAMSRAQHPPPAAPAGTPEHKTRKEGRTESNSRLCPRRRVEGSRDDEPLVCEGRQRVESAKPGSRS